MKLSDAVVLGDGLKKCDPGMWLSEDGSCGCAFGGAILASGISAQEYAAQLNKALLASALRGDGDSFQAVAETPFVMAEWPWLKRKHLVEISRLYANVHRRQATIYDVAAYCRSIEPAETSANEVRNQGPGVSVSAEQRAENLPPHEASQSRPYGSAISDVHEVVERVLAGDKGATCQECFGEFFADEPNDADAVGDFCSLACENEHKQQALMSEQP